MKRKICSLLVVLIVIIISGCEEPVLSNEKSITGYSFADLKPAVAGVITGAAIELTVPYETDLTKLAATFITTGTGVTVGDVAQVSGTTVNDFTEPVTYTVVAEDGSFRNYAVIVTISEPYTIFETSKRFETFSMLADDNSVLDSDIEGTISGSAIELTVPYGSDLTKLVATFTSTGTGVTVGDVAQVSGTTVNDFTEPVTYTVTAEDGTSRNYVVIASISDPFTMFETFSFQAEDNSVLTTDVTGGISGNTITLNVPYIEDVSDLLDSLVAEFSTPGATVTVDGTVQESCFTANDFSDTIVYRVTAEDGTTRDYNVDVYVTVDKTQLSSMIAADLDVTRVDTSGITDMSGLFASRSLFNQDISGWDVSSVTDMSEMFYDVWRFNQDISDWQVGNVSDMSKMFYNAMDFDQDISGWDVGNVANMAHMFRGATNFNQDIGGWDVRRVTNMSNMFYQAMDFSQDIGGWEVGKVTDMSHMFHNVMRFNGDISGWDVGNVTNMEFMFYSAKMFNQNIGGWNVGNVTDMESMFYSANMFNQNIGGWNVGNVTNMDQMLYSAEVFDQDLSEWDVSNVSTHTNFADDSPIEMASAKLPVFP